MSQTREWSKCAPRSGCNARGGDMRVSVVVDASPTEEAPGTLQEFAEECDINNIMAKFQRTGALEWCSKYEGTFDDVTGYSFQAAMDVIVRAEEMFEELPSSIRDRFHHDPAAFMDFIHDESNAEEARRLGLRKPLESPPPIPVAVAPSSEPASQG